MRAGSLDRTITVQRLAETRDEYGGTSTGWTDVATVRAQLIEQATSDFMQGAGEEARRIAVFRCRWIAGLTNADRVMFEGLAYDVEQVKEIGRRRGVELRCRAAAS